LLVSMRDSGMLSDIFLSCDLGFFAFAKAECGIV